MIDEGIIRIKLEDDGKRAVSPPPPPGTLPGVGVPAPTGDASSGTGAAAPPPIPPRDWVRELVEGVAGANKHVLLEGQSGSGKSLLTKHIAFERMKRGEEVHVVDQHNPEAWGGAKQVFQGARAGAEAARFMREVLQSRKAEASEAKLRGELPDFKPMTIVLSDFARLMKDTPELADEFRTLLTEARKFRVSIVADTTAMTAAATGAKGILDIRANFGQKVKLEAPTAADPTRRARKDGETFDVPMLPDYAERRDYGLVKEEAESPPSPLGPEAAARRNMEKEQYNEEVRRARMEIDPGFRAKEEEKQQKREEREEKKRQADEDKANRQLAAAVAQTERAREKEQLRLQREDEKRQKQEEHEEKQRRADADKAERQLAVAMRQTEQAREKEQKRVEKEKEKEQKKEQEESSKKGFTGFLKTLTSMRGFVGGTFGKLAGASLDVMGAVRPGAGVAGMAAPVAGLVLAVDQAVKGAIKGVISGAGSLLTGAARTGEDPSQTIHALSSAVSSFGDKIPILGTALVVVGEAGKVLAGLMQEFTKTAERYAEYNPAIAQQLAMNEIRQIMSDMRRAQTAGPELARMLQAQADVQQRFEDIKMKIWMKVLPVLTAILEVVASILNIAVEQNDNINAAQFDPTSIIMGELGAAPMQVP